MIAITKQMTVQTVEIDMDTKAIKRECIPSPLLGRRG